MLPTDKPDPKDFGLTEPLYTVKETCRMLRMCRDSFYKAVAKDQIRIKKRGRQSLVYATEIAAYLSWLRDAPRG